MYKTAFTIILAVLLSSCGVKYHVKVDSFGKGPMSDMTYTLLPSSPDILGLEYEEYSKYIHLALEEKGYINVDNQDNSKMVIFLNYGISDPSTYETTSSIPQWGQTGVSSSYTTGSINSYGGYGSYSGTTSYTPSYGITGYTPVTSRHTEYTRYLKLTAVDSNLWKNNNESQELWKTSVISTGSSGDLRNVMPYMIVASKPHIGTNTGQQLKIIVDGEDKRVKNLRSGKKNEELKPKIEKKSGLEKLLDIF